MTQRVDRFLDTVVTPGFCVGCGACAALEGSPLEMKLGSDGRFRPSLRPDGEGAFEARFEEVCPFAARINEDDIARARLDGDGTQADERLGTFRQLVAGHVEVGPYREAGSSGGMTTWFIAKLLEDDLVDAVLHVQPQPDDSRLFAYAISQATTDVVERAKTRYYPVEMSEVLTHVRETPGRYAVVGLPCFIKAVRLLQAEHPVFAERVRYCVGLVCGHLKSSRFAEALAWEAGVAPEELKHLEFRAKNDVAADAYDVVAVGEDGAEKRRRSSSLLVSDWGMGMFKYRACDFCDDVTAETADVSFGDAWLPEFTSDARGANIAIVRSQDAQDVVAAHHAELSVQDMTPDAIARSQAAGLRHRREGLAYRLAKAEAAGERTPRKRVQPSNQLPKRRATIYDQRTAFIDLADVHFREAIDARHWGHFEQSMKPHVERYREIYAASSPLKAWVKRRLPMLFSSMKRLKHALRR